MRIPRRATLASLLAFLLLPSLAAAQRQIIMHHFDAQVVVDRNSTIDVTENIDTEFVGTGWHGIYRTIPVEYSNPEGLNYTLFIDNVRATDGTGHPLRIEQDREGRYLRLRIYVPEPDNSARTIVLHYRVLDAIRYFPDHDELYWNVTGEEWDVPIESASASIELPEGATGVHATAYTGVYMSRTQDANVIINGNVIEIHASHRLGYHEGLTAVVGFDKGLVHQPTASEKFGRFMRSNWPMFLFPLATLALMLWVWRTRGRDPERDAITVQYEPPDKLTPAECGTLVENQVAMRDITATLVDLAVKGYMTIEQKDHSGLLGLTHHRDYVFHLKKPPAEWTDARPHEQEMLSGIFNDGATTDVDLSGLQNHFYTHMPAIRDGIYNALVGDGYYPHRPDTVRAGYIGTGAVIGFIIIALGMWWAKQTGMPSLTWIVAGLASGAIICIFAFFMIARTASGARTVAKVLGFEDFLSKVEADRIKRMENAPELFEKFLPYAMALRVEKKWVQAFSGITLQPPQWYTGPAYVGGFQPFFLMNDLNLMTAQAGSALASAPRSAGSGISGFGGGGGAGGGFGGGGGGGF